MEQRFTMAEEVGQLFCREMVAAHTEGRLYDRDGEGLTAIAEIGHIARFRLKEFLGRNLTIGRNQLVEMVLYGFEMRLAVPEGVVGIEGDDSQILDYFPWQCGHIPFSIKLTERSSKPGGKVTSGMSI